MVPINCTTVLQSLSAAVSAAVSPSSNTAVRPEAVARRGDRTVVFVTRKGALVTLRISAARFEMARTVEDALARQNLQQRRHRPTIAEAIRALCDHVVVMSAGGLIASGAPDAVLGEIVEVLAASIRAAFPEETR